MATNFLPKHHPEFISISPLFQTADKESANVSVKTSYVGLKNLLRYSILTVFAVVALCQLTYAQTGGLGVTIDIDPKSKFPYIVEVLKGLPAEKMNLAPNDFIIKINGQSTYNYTLEQTISVLKGSVGSDCNITVWRNNIEYPLTFTRAALTEPVCTIYNNALPAFTTFKWSGSCLSGYADGYGTLQLIKDGQYLSYYVGYMKAGYMEGEGTYYYANGTKMLEGTFRNNQLNGMGKKYDITGNLKFEGYFQNNELPNLSSMDKSLREMGTAIVDELFDGGTNIKSTLVGLRRYNQNANVANDNLIIDVKIAFNGNIITDNYYEVTLRIQCTPQGDSYKFIDYNDMAFGYGVAKLGVKLGMMARKLDAIFNK